MEPRLNNDDLSFVAIIITNWNGFDDTEACLRSLSHLKGVGFRVYLVENGSLDDSAERIRELIPSLPFPLVFLPLPVNLGFAGGNNVGIRRAMADGANFVWLLNNDAEVEPETLHALVDRARRDTRIGMVGSKIYFAGSDVLWYAGARSHRWTGRAHVRGLYEIDRGQYDRAEPTGFVTGCSLLVSTACIREVGFMYSDFFLYYEDAEWNLRAARVGWEQWYEPASIVYHKVSQSSRTGSRNSPTMVYYNIRNRFVMLQRVGSPLQRVTAVLYLAYQIFSQVRMLSRRDYARRASFMYLFLGARDALIRRMGKAPAV